MADLFPTPSLSMLYLALFAIYLALWGTSSALVAWYTGHDLDDPAQATSCLTLGFGWPLVAVGLVLWLVAVLPALWIARGVRRMVP